MKADWTRPTTYEQAIAACLKIEIDATYARDFRRLAKEQRCALMARAQSGGGTASLVAGIGDFLNLWLTAE